MRLTLTVADPAGDVSATVLLDTDPDTPVSKIADVLVRQVRPTGVVPAEPAVGLRVTSKPPVRTSSRPASPTGHGTWLPGMDDSDTPATTNSGINITHRFDRPALATGRPALFIDGHRVIETLTLAESPIREGTLISVGSPAGCLPREPPGLLEVRVVGGPGAGVVHRLGPGEHMVGAGAICAVRLDDPDVATEALTITVMVDGSWSITPTGTPNDHTPGGVLINREPLRTATAMPTDAQITIGSVLLELGMPSRADAALKPSDDGVGLDFNRPPRLLPPIRRTRYKLPGEPSEPERRPMPILMATLPLAGGVAMALVFKQYYFLLMAVVGPLGMIGMHISGARHGRRSYRKQLADYRRRRKEVEADARDALVIERGARRADFPDPATVLLTAVGPRGRLWERRRDNPDYLHLRLGTADLPSEVVMEDPAAQEHKREITWTAPDVPVTIALPERGVLGIAGRGELPRVLACWLIAQAATLHSPRDLAICILTDSSGEQAWNWVRWLPHCRPNEGQDTVVLLGTDDESRARRVGELLAALATRADAQAKSNGTGLLTDSPDVLVVMDGARRLRSIPGMISILRDGPALGIRSICLDRDIRLLPEECQAVVEETPAGLRVVEMRTEIVNNVRPDLVATAPPGDPGEAVPVGSVTVSSVTVSGVAAWCERLARALAPVRDVGGDDETAIPTSARLLDVIGLEPPTAAAVAARWQVSPRSTAFGVGMSLDGPFALDLRRDGPHGLIAGTTGSGKSELLQSIVASLAVVNRPDAMTFVLVDYKGGSAFADCVKLPHTVGMVTDLDTHLVARALESLSAELRRREHILADAGAKDIEDYTLLVTLGTARTPAGRPLTPLPRLLLVIDEFASLARELPDFVTGLVNIAQRGRSLGIHLLLATQRPSGVVSPEIRANTNLRIALRVTDTSESSDVVNAPDAARISPSTPGRAFVRLGHASLVPFQSGRVGGRRPTGAAGVGTATDAGTVTTELVPPWVTELNWPALGQPVPRPPRPRTSDNEITDLRVLVNAIREAASTLRIAPQHSPWLAPLPELLTVQALLGSVSHDSHSGGPHTGGPHTGGGPYTLPPVPIGLSDHCDRQAQHPYTVDIEHGGHLLFVGSPRSGRSTALRTLAGAIASTISSRDVHLYALDCGNNALAPLVSLPHTGAVVSRDTPERVQRLFTRIIAEVVERQETFAARGYSDLAEQRSVDHDHPLPYLLLLIDRFEGFLASFEDVDGGTLVEMLTRLLREGPSVGLRIIMTGDRRSASGRFSGAIENRFVLRMADRSDYTMVGLASGTVPDGLPAGRGLRVEGSVETQLALLAEDPSGRAQVAALQELARAAAVRDGVPPGPAAGARTDYRRPFRIDMLPGRITVAETEALRPAPRTRRVTDVTGPLVPLIALVGAGGDELAPIDIDLASDGPGFVIAGPSRSGRSSALLTMAESLLAGGAQLLLVTPRRSPLSALANRPGVIEVLGADAKAASIDAACLSVGPAGGLVVILDDAELLANASVADRLTEFLRTARDAGCAFVAAGTTEDLTSQYRGFMVDARRSRCGVILAPSTPNEGDLFGMRLSRNTGGAMPVGRGLFVHRGRTTPVQIAFPVSTRPASHHG
ncbi:FtsK/SpoIIIE domain-containing protein [Frankia sp. Cppng1_Ct_nod]|uniref:FtsK/SpoIIIE domain-containing protein n=1 Tax=Frankia sp. Cppng1_Ct_nod TaxID=2897162 RepID=UPI001F5E4B0E|nr:FtsK/SpoIIIE domain-containing protein [Frankia sp. Cppng1_Ct_nod]